MILLQRLAGIVLGLALAAAALVFVSVVLAIAAAIALVAGGWLWWRSRDSRPADGAVIEGEYRVEREVRRLEDPDGPPRS